MVLTYLATDSEEGSQWARNIVVRALSERRRMAVVQRTLGDVNAQSLTENYSLGFHGVYAHPAYKNESLPFGRGSKVRSSNSTTYPLF